MSEALIRRNEQQRFGLGKIGKGWKRGVGGGSPTRKQCWGEDDGIDYSLQALASGGKAELTTERHHNFGAMLARIHASTSSAATTLTSGLVKA